MAKLLSVNLWPGMSNSMMLPTMAQRTAFLKRSCWLLAVSTNFLAWGNIFSAFSLASFLLYLYESGLPVSLRMMRSRLVPISAALEVDVNSLFSSLTISAKQRKRNAGLVVA